jgi:hypothetical protein
MSLIHVSGWGLTAPGVALYGRMHAAAGPLLPAFVLEVDPHPRKTYAHNLNGGSGMQQELAVKIPAMPSCCMLVLSIADGSGDAATPLPTAAGSGMLVLAVVPSEIVAAQLNYLQLKLPALR